MTQSPITEALEALERIETFINDCECMCAGINDDIRAVENYIRAALTRSAIPGLEEAIEWGNNVLPSILAKDKLQTLIDAARAHAGVGVELPEIFEELYGEFDRQTYNEKQSHDFDPPDDAEFCINLTARQLRDFDKAMRTALSPATQKEGG